MVTTVRQHLLQGQPIERLPHLVPDNTSSKAEQLRDLFDRTAESLVPARKRCVLRGKKSKHPASTCSAKDKQEVFFFSRGWLDDPKFYNHLCCDQYAIHNAHYTRNAP